MIVKAHKKVDYCGFAGTRGTYNCNGLSLPCIYRNILKNDLVLCVAEGYVLKTYVTFYILQSLCINSILFFGLFVKNSENTLCRRKCRLNFVKDI